LIRIAVSNIRMEDLRKLKTTEHALRLKNKLSR